MGLGVLRRKQLTINNAVVEVILILLLASANTGTTDPRLNNTRLAAREPHARALDTDPRPNNVQLKAREPYAKALDTALAQEKAGAILAVLTERRRGRRKKSRRSMTMTRKRNVAVARKGGWTALFILTFLWNSCHGAQCRNGQKTISSFTGYLGSNILGRFQRLSIMDEDALSVAIFAESQIDVHTCESQLTGSSLHTCRRLRLEERDEVADVVVKAETFY